jgi:DMSO/TMAO reductase YedYZ molybdopterin-dependent catalytic subunit
VVVTDRAAPVRAARVPWRRAAWAGVLTVAVALGVAELATGLIEGSENPVVSVGEVVVDHVPSAIRDWAISVFGTTDKTVLIIGTVVLLVLFGALVGVLAAKRRWVAPVGIGVFTAIGVAAAVTRPDAEPIDALPTLAGAVAALIALPWLLRMAEEPVVEVAVADRAEAPAAAPAPPDGLGRRRFLLAGVATGAGAVIAGSLGRFLQGRFQVDAARNELVLPAPRSPAAPVPATAEVGVTGTETFLTPNSDFYRIDTALVVPQLSPDVWRLRVHGMVDRELELTFDDLLARPMVERLITLTCVSNEIGGDLVGNARWLGTPLADLLREAGVHSGADQLVSRSFDGWTCGTPTSVLLDGRDALLAVGMNGEPLPVTHGFPARLVVPGLYGYVSATKWVTELELTTFDAFDAYWVRLGWAQQAPIKTMSRIDTPRGGSRPAAGRIPVAGVAWAQHRGIDRVEVQVDDGPWQDAHLADQATIDAWRLWGFDWDATSGSHRLRARATDGTGEVQTSDSADPIPDGATGWHTVFIDVR